MPTTIADADLARMAQSFRLAIANGHSPRTVRSYLEAVDGLDRYLAAQGMPRVLAAISREHVESFIADLLARHSKATAANRYAGLRAFFRWAVEEGEIKASPMARMHPPKVVPPRPTPPTKAELGAVLHSLERLRDFRGIRDHAILRVFIATGVRLSELSGLRWAPDDPRRHDVDLTARFIRVTGKGERERVVRLSPDAVRALDRYERARRKHPAAESGAYWLGAKGAYRVSAMQHMVGQRAAAVGLTWHPHLLRHAFIHYSLAAGTNETDVMAAVGHRDLSMIHRVYGAALAQDRAMEAMDRHRWDDGLT